MMKRILAFCLVLVMVLGMVPTFALAAEESVVSTEHLAYYASDITVDDVIDETDWYLYGKMTDSETNASRAFDVLWDQNTLYLAVQGKANDELVVESAEYDFYNSQSMSGDFEFAIDMSHFGGAVTDYGRVIPLKLSVIGDDGTSVWSGNVTLSSANRAQAVTGWSQTHKDSTTNLKTAILDDGGLNFSRKYGNGTTTTAYDAAIYKILNDGTYATTDNLEMTSLEFDFRCDSMPEYNSLGKLSGAYAARGFSMSYTDGVNNSATGRPDCVSFGITNSNGTLYAMVGFGYDSNAVAAVSTGKGLGETFHVQLITTADRALEIYIDGELIRTVENAVLNTYPLGAENSTSIPVIRLANYGYPGKDGEKTDGSDDVDFTLWNVTLGETCGASVMDGLTWDTIRGENASQDTVGTNLNLVTSLTNSQLGTIALDWTSTNEEAIDPDTGVVTLGVEDQAVTLTASVTADPTVSKTFEVVIPAKTLVATLAEEEIVLDGVLDEASWAQAGTREFSVLGGMSSAKVYALWSAGNLYLGFEAADINQVFIELNDLMTSYITGGSIFIAQSGNVVELQVLLDQFGIEMQDYNEAYPLSITLEDTSGNTAAMEDSDINVIFSSKYFTSVASTVDVSAPNMNGKTGSADSTGYNATEGAWQHTANNGLCYWLKTDIEAMSDHSLDILTEIDMNITAMPVGSGTIQNDFTAQGVYIWVSDLDVYTTKADGTLATNGYYSFANIYNKANGALVIKSRNGADVELGVSVGERFTLGYQWNADDSVTIYVNGTEVGSFASNSKYVSGAGKDVVQIRAQSPVSGQNTSVSIYSVDVTASGDGYVKLEDELSKANVLADIDLTDLTDDAVITLPGTWETKLGTFELSWASANSDVLAVTENEDGTWSVTVKQPNKAVTTYVNLTMTGNGREFWSAEASVKGLGADAETTATTLRVPFTAAPMVIDGATTDEGWSFNIKTIKSGVSTGRFGAQWNTENLFLALDTKGNGVPAVTVEGKTLDMSSAAVSGDVYELSVALSDLGVVLTDYEYEMDASVTIGNATWEGTLVLTSTDWFITDGVDPRLVIPAKGTVKLGADAPTSNQGYEDIGNGWRLFDLYSATGSNPAKVRTYLLAWGTGGTEEDLAFYAPLNDRTQPTYCEFDFKAVSMPEYVAGNGTNGATDWSSLFACYGFTWQIAAKADGDKNSDSVVMGIYNTADGLVMAVLRATDTVHIELGKEIGNQFRLSTRWELDGDLSIYVDGELIERVENVEANRNAYGDNSLIMNLIRSTTRAASGADSFDIEITNISLGKDRGSSIFEQLTIEDILGDNTDPYAVTKDLVLVESIYDDQLDITADITWEISDTDVVAEDFTVTRPAAGGKLVKLTASWNGQSKTFEVYVKGVTYESDVMVVIEDLNPAIGSATLLDTYQFTLDNTHNSVVYDQNSVKEINLITLVDGDEVNRLNESALTIWVSDNNRDYTRVENFKMKRDGKYTYLYDFEAEGRYIKVHCTHYLGTDADFTGFLEDMIRVEYKDTLNPFNNYDDSTVCTGQYDTYVENFEGYTLYDEVYQLDPDHGIVAAEKMYVFNPTTGEIYYHYCEDDKVYVRIPTLESGETLDLMVNYYAEDADIMDLSNKEYVLETVYGTRETKIIDDSAGRWVVELPDNSLMSITCGGDKITEEGWLTVTYSYDFGMNWTDPVEIECTREWLRNPGGVTYDPNNGRIIVEGYQYTQFVANDMDSSDCKLRFIYSDDLGKTWNRCPDISFDGEKATYVLSYSDPVIVSSYDGEGPNIDMVLNNGVQYGDDGTFCCRVAYTTDAGLTWTLGADKIRYSSGEGIIQHEGGVSEGTILEDKTTPGKLVLYARCQYDSINVFCKSYSYDYGKTWEAAAQLTQTYTVNTQPIFHEFNGAQLLFWGGNNVYGGNSYQRMPMNVAITYDNMETFVNIQDLYARTSLQGMTTATRNQIINQSMTTIGDTATVVWDNNFKESLIMRVDNFTDWFYRTKGAYDSFENSTPKYEGWSTTAGTVISSDEQRWDGNHAMKISRAGAAVRTVPYVQSGKIEMYVYLNEDIDFTMELESAYSPDYGEAAPVAMTVVDGAVSFLGSDEVYEKHLADGWNKIEFVLNLADEEPAVDVIINGGNPIAAPVNTAIGDYVCWFDVNAGAPLYIDAFRVDDNDVIEVPEAPAEPELPEGVELFYGVNMKLGNDLSMNFFIDKLRVADATYAEFTFNGETTVVKKADWAVAGSYYKLTFDGMAAKEMGDDISVQLFDADGNPVSERYTDSVMEYVGRIVEKDNVSAADKTALVDMLFYGTAAQNAFTYRVDRLVSNYLDAEHAELATQTVEVSDNSVAGTNYYGSSLNLKANIQLNTYFTNVTEDMTATISYTNHNGVAKSYEVDVVMDSGYGKVTLDQMVLADAFALITVEVKDADGNVVASVVDSVESYCSRTMESQKELNEALMKFASSAYKLFHPEA